MGNLRSARMSRSMRQLGGFSDITLGALQLRFGMDLIIERSSGQLESGWAFCGDAFQEGSDESVWVRVTNGKGISKHVSIDMIEKWQLLKMSIMQRQMSNGSNFLFISHIGGVQNITPSDIKFDESEGGGAQNAAGGRRYSGRTHPQRLQCRGNSKIHTIRSWSPIGCSLGSKGIYMEPACVMPRHGDVQRRESQSSKYVWDTVAKTVWFMLGRLYHECRGGQYTCCIKFEHAPIIVRHLSVDGRRRG